MNTFNRRNFLKFTSAAALTSGLPASFQLYGASADYSGKLLIVMQANGGWDVTSFCDPKVNVAGELPINNWAYESEPQSAGNIRFAPFANNQAFFEKYYKDMLIINGIDVQTNSHDAGHIHTYSGRLSAGYPTITSLFSSIQAPNLSMSYLSNPGAWSQTADLIRFTQLGNPNRLLDVINPEQTEVSGYQWFRDDDWESINQARQSRMASLISAEAQLAQQLKSRVNYQNAINNSASLTDFETALRNAGEIYSNEPFEQLRRQVQLTLTAMSAGVTCAADLSQAGFDSHGNHDEEQTIALDRLTDAIDYLWTYAEELGLADRILLVVGSDMGRTPWYNEGAGKDHWPVTSMMVMERNQSWTNRTIGFTDEGHFALPLNANSHEQDDNGVIIYPKDVMQSLREYLGIAQHDNATSFSFSGTSNFGFFN